jgi:hypothetical protein
MQVSGFHSIDSGFCCIDSGLLGIGIPGIQHQQQRTSVADQETNRIMVTNCDVVGCCEERDYVEWK